MQVVRVSIKRVFPSACSQSSITGSLVIRDWGASPSPTRQVPGRALLPWIPPARLTQTRTLGRSQGIVKLTLGVTQQRAVPWVPSWAGVMGDLLPPAGCALVG